MLTWQKYDVAGELFLLALRSCVLWEGQGGKARHWLEVYGGMLLDAAVYRREEA